jgi:hypothetical protein
MDRDLTAPPLSRGFSEMKKPRLGKSGETTRMEFLSFPTVDFGYPVPLPKADILHRGASFTYPSSTPVGISP